MRRAMRRTGQPSLANLESALGHDFRQKQLLVQALTHSSLAFERSTEAAAAGESADEGEPGSTADVADNEQLEFLGDAVVGLLVAEFLFKRYPELEEGELTRLRANLVSRSHLGRVSELLHLGEYLHLGKGEERSGGRKKGALLANCIEAVMGALYLDGGLETVRTFVEREVASPYVDALHEELERGHSIGDHKSALQQYLQARKRGQPEYVVKASSGPDHRKRFLVEVRLAEAGVHLARGIGSTKKKAEQEAARRAVEKLRAGRVTLARHAKGEADEAQDEGRPERPEDDAVRTALAGGGQS